MSSVDGCFFFFFKQKTAYEMRIGDWSSDVCSSDLIAVGRVKIDYRDGSGKAQALVEGTSGVPFRIAANADLTPELWRASVRGRATGINFRTTSPARIIPGTDGDELLPTPVNLGSGSTARIAGRFGEGFMVQSRLERVNMAILKDRKSTRLNSSH